MRIPGLLTIGCLAAMTVSADGIDLQIPSQAVTTGQSVSEDVTIAGLGLPPEVGSFDLFIGFDPALLTPVNVQYGLLLGDPGLFEALTAVTLGATSVEAAEVSLLTNAQLDSLQSPSFVLATLTFDAVASGEAQFTYLGGPVDDGDGLLIFGSKELSPEPGPALPVAAGLVLLTALFHRKRL